MKDGFLALHKKDFEITGGGKMETFLGMAVEQKGKSIKIHLDNYVKEVLAEYADYIKRSLRPMTVPISPGVAFKAEDVPELPDQLKQKNYRSLWYSFSLLQHGYGSTFRSWYSSWHVLCNGGLGPIASSPPSHGISCGTSQLQDRVSQRYETSGPFIRVC